jgi:hypothetical protein
MKTFAGQETERQLVADGSSITNHLTKILAIFKVLFWIFHGISKYLNIYSTISGEILDDAAGNFGWEAVS